MNVDNFTVNIAEVLRRIEGNDPESIPKDIYVIVAMCFLDTDVDEFKLVIKVYHGRSQSGVSHGRTRYKQ